MAHKVGIYYDESGMREIMKRSGIANLEQELMMQKLDEVRAAFLQEFGFEGTFIVKKVETSSRRSRVTFRICADNARTTKALKSKPGWLGKFLN